MYLDADGRCTSCHKELPVGWHADHDIPHSKGGRTEPWNGKALCPDCNLSKSDSLPEDVKMSTKEEGYKPRAWALAAQKVMFERIEAGEQDTLSNNAPACGKTRFALAAAQELKARGIIDKIVVVAPTVGIANQFVEDALRYHGLRLGIGENKREGRAKLPGDGVVITYSTLSNQPSLYRLLLGKRGLVIMDEVHHLGDAFGWGVAAMEAFKDAFHRLSMTGTAFRSDGHAIPFVRYNEDNVTVADYTYSWRDAWRAGIIREIEFVKWGSDGVMLQGVETALADCTSDEELAEAFRSMHHPDSKWISTVVGEAHRQLLEARRVLPNAGSMLVARDQWHAREYVSVVERVTGTTPMVIVSDDPEFDPHELIDEFRDSDIPWLISVKMISEGISIPRLVVGIDASNVQTELFFQQLAGRFARKVPGDTGLVGILFYPPTPDLVRIAKNLEDQLPKSENPPEGKPKPRDPSEPRTDRYAEPARDGHHAGTTIDGVDFDAHVIRRAVRFANRNAGRYSEATVIQLLRDEHITIERVEAWESTLDEAEFVPFVSVKEDVERAAFLGDEFNRIKKRIAANLCKIDNNDADVKIDWKTYTAKVGRTLQGANRDGTTRKLDTMTLVEREVLVEKASKMEMETVKTMADMGLM